MYALGWTPDDGNMTPLVMRMRGKIGPERYHYGTGSPPWSVSDYIALDEVYSTEDVITACKRALEELGVTT